MIWTSTEQIASVLSAMSDARDQALKARGQRIAELRLARGWSQEDLAHKIGVGVGTVSRWERGLHAGYPEHSRDLAEMLGVPVAELRVEPLPTFMDQLDQIEAKLETLLEAISSAEQDRHRIEAEVNRQGALLDTLSELMERQLADRVVGAARRARGQAPRSPRSKGRRDAA